MIKTIAHFAGSVRLAAGLMGLAMMLTGCGMSGVGLLSSNGFSDISEQSGDAAVTEETLLDSAKADYATGSVVSTVGTSCPKFVVWPRDRRLTVYEPGQEGDGLAIRHRGEITRTARECAIEPGKVDVKYGLAGRVLLGPKGKPGTVILPVKVHVADLNREIVATQVIKVKVTVPDDKPYGFFSVVNKTSFPLPEGTRPDDYQLFVAFDRGTGESG